MPNEPYRILSITEGTTADNYGRIVRTQTIKYMVGQDGPFTYVVPSGQGTAALITTALTALAANITAIRGAQ